MNRKSYPECVRSALFHAIKKTAANLDACVKVPGKDFSRKRKLPLQTMLLMLIGMGGGSLSKELWQHRAIASLRFAGSFPPILRFEKFEIHTVFLHFPNLDLTKNLSPNLLAELCGAALDKNRIHRRWMRFCVIRKAPAHEEACRIARLRVPFAAPREALKNSSPDSSRSAPLSAEPRADARL